MKYGKTCEARFLSRPNRFTALVEREGQQETVHVKNTGRCRELLVPGTRVILEESANPNRKTKYDLICAEKNGRLINMDSQVCNKVVREFLEAGRLYEDLAEIRPEFTWGESRFDFRCLRSSGQPVFIEVKGVTLENQGIAAFPDAPTQRGLKHVRELEKAAGLGYECFVFFVVQMDGIHHMEPNWITQPEFARALQKAEQNGVRILCCSCSVAEDEIVLADPVPFAFSALFRPEIEES